MFRHDPTYLTYSSNVAMTLALLDTGKQTYWFDYVFVTLGSQQKSARKLQWRCLARWMCQGLRPRPSIGCDSKGGFLKWWYRGTQQPWVFLLKMIILGCEMGVRPFKETPKKSLGCLGFLHWEGLIPGLGRGLDHYTFFFSHMDFGSFHFLESHYSSTIWKGNKPDV